jgi:ubiquinone/menaquinone biosynthesis C-methylase UbiE
MTNGGSAAYDEVAEAYHRTFDPDGIGLRDPVFDRLVGGVAGQDVLALACGQGQDARRLADLGARVVGIDISEPMLDYARKYEETTPRGIRYVRGDAQTLAAFSVDSFDGAICHMALMDIPKLEPTISSVERVLRSGGWFVFSIVHPCYGPHVDIVDAYLAETRYEKRLPVDALPRHAYHRPLSGYINTLAQARFSITGMVEHYHETNDGRAVPGLLYLRCLKTIGPKVPGE